MQLGRKGCTAGDLVNENRPADFYGLKEDRAALVMLMPEISREMEGNLNSNFQRRGSDSLLGYELKKKSEEKPITFPYVSKDICQEYLIDW